MLSCIVFQFKSNVNFVFLLSAILMEIKLKEFPAILSANFQTWKFCEYACFNSLATCVASCNISIPSDNGVSITNFEVQFYLFLRRLGGNKITHISEDLLKGNKRLKAL
jgi:hypothetical protein